MAGSIAGLICFHLTLYSSYSFPLHSETDSHIDVGIDTTPVKIPETAYINPFKKRAASLSESEQELDVIVQPLLSNYIPDEDDEWATSGNEDEDVEHIENIHLNRVSNRTDSSSMPDDGIKRCHEYVNNFSKEYSIEGLQDSDSDISKFSLASTYLCKFGYLTAGGDVSEALTEFQRFVKLTPTGVVDHKTLELMKLPRCGDSDVRSTDGQRKKRWAHSKLKWGNSELKYHIAKYTSDIPNKVQRQEIERATKLWSDYAPIDFKLSRKYKVGEVDIVLSFQYYYHRDDFSFDGTGGELAHAFLPEKGLIHFDDSEKWTAENDGSGTNLFLVAAHEIGHSLGLEHSSKRGALMSPFIDNFSADNFIHPDDIVSIQNLYGSRGDKLKYHCPSVIRWETAFTDSVSGFSYAFYNEQVWKFDENGLLPGFPQLTISVFSGLPSVKIEATLAFKNGYSYLFSDDRYWKYNATNGRMAAGYPKSKALWGLKKDIKINDAIRWPRNNYVYFFSVGQYYRYNSATGRMDDGYPQPLYLWQGAPFNFDGAMTSMDGSYTFFFLHNYYFPFNNRKAAVDPSQVQEIKYSFFLCEEEVSEESDKNRARFIKETNGVLADSINTENWERFKRLEIDLIAPHLSSSPQHSLATWLSVCIMFRLLS